MFRKAPLLGFVILMIATTAIADGPPMFVSKWGTGGTGDGQFKYPRGITVGSDGYIYVTEWYGHRVQKFTRDGEFVAKWGAQGIGDGQFDGPLGIATDAEGNVFVAEHNNHRVQKFTGDGTFITKWGSRGSTDGRFNKPTGVAVDGSGNVYVADYDGRRVQKFTGNGQWLRTWTGTEGGGPQYYRPWGLAVDSNGFIYVAEYGGNRVRKLTPDGTLVTLWGGTYGSGDGQFKAPTGICLDRLGNIYVADHENHRIQKFTKDGQFLAKWGTYGSGDGQFAWVSGVAVSADNHIYTAGYVNNRVDRFMYPMAIRVTAQVRAEHDDGPFVTPSPPLANLTVKLALDGQEWTGVTGANGVVGFPVARSSGGQYELRLEGPSYRIKIDRRWPLGNIDPPTRVVPADAVFDTTLYTWPTGSDLEEGPALQAAYFVERFRSDYLLERFGYEWTLPARHEKPDNAVQVVIHHFDPDPLKKWGQGAGVFDFQQGIWFYQHRCEESDALFHELVHCVICDRAYSFFPGRGGLLNAENDEGNAMDEGLADYFAASFTNDPVIVRCSWPVSAPCKPLRVLGTETVRYPGRGCYRYDRYEGSHILSGALWELRGLIDGVNAPEASITDPLVFAAIDTMLSRKTTGYGDDPDFYFDDFYAALKRVDAEHGSQFASDIDEVFSSRNLGTNTVPFCPLAWNQDDGIISVNEIGDGEVELTWRGLLGAVSYSVLINSFDYGAAQGTGLGAFVPIATGVTDTMYTFTARDSLVEYVFSVVAIDNAGQQGYKALPVIVPTSVPTGVGGDRPVGPGAISGRFLFNSPNPFNPQTRIVFEVSQSDDIMLTVFDVTGKKVRRFSTKRYAAGRHEVVWDGKDDRGRQVASSPYFVLLSGTSWKSSGKVLLLK